MFGFVCVGGWDRGVGDVVVVSMGTRLLTAAIQKGGKTSIYAGLVQLATVKFQFICREQISAPAMMSSSVSVSVCAGVATMSPSGAG